MWHNQIGDGIAKWNMTSKGEIWHAIMEWSMKSPGWGALTSAWQMWQIVSKLSYMSVFFSVWHASGPELEALETHDQDLVRFKEGRTDLIRINKVIQNFERYLFHINSLFYLSFDLSMEIYFLGKD